MSIRFGEGIIEDGIYEWRTYFMGDTKEAPKPAAKATPAEVLKQAPSVTEVLARPMVYEAWLKKAQEALNG